MATSLDVALSKLARYLNKDCQITLPGDARGEVEGYVFDKRAADGDELEMFLEDTFGDGVPDGLDLESSAPFCIIGFTGNPLDPDGDADGQTEGVLFLDLAAGDGKTCPVTAIDVDGTAIPDTYRQVAARIEDLQIEAS